MKKRMLAMVLTLCLLLGMVPAGVMAADDTGGNTCGENLTWTLENGVLTISGTGEMENYYQIHAPWYENHSSITSVVIEDGVTTISGHAFRECESLTSITIPGSVTSIGAEAF